MNRRLKDTPGIGIGIPPKTEITLVVPLSRLQRYWYRRLLTGFDQSLLDEILLESRKMDEQGGLQESGFQDSVKSVAQEWLEMVQSMVQSPDTHQSPLVKLPQKYRKLNNLLMQLRKVRMEVLYVSFSLTSSVLCSSIPSRDTRPRSAR